MGCIAKQDGYGPKLYQQQWREFTLQTILLPFFCLSRFF